MWELTKCCLWGTVSEISGEESAADIEIGGVSVRCVLDTGAETSLIPASFYHEHLTGMVKGLQSVGTFIKIVGMNDLDVLIGEYLDVPISIFGQTIMASFFVKSDSASIATGRRVKLQ